MAQSKREPIEPINVTTKNIPIARAEKNTVPDLLLQYHQLNLIRRVANRISFRTLFSLMVGCLVLVNHLSLIQLIVFVSTALIATFIWNSERRLLVTRQKALEKILAERSGDDWEDIYIQFKYHTSMPFGFYKSSYEPFIWAFLVCSVGLMRFYFDTKFGH